MTYDEFEATMLEAGWTLDEIEEQWKNYDPECSSGACNDPWETEAWDKD